MAGFVIVFVLGQLFYVEDRGNDSLTITGTVFDADNKQGIPEARVIVKAGNTYERTTVDSGDFKVDNTPGLTGKQVVVLAKALNYRDSDPITVLLDRGNSRFSIPLTNCYNGIWHETDNYGIWKGNTDTLKWRFDVKGDELHIFRIDGFVTGAFNRSQDGWKGQLNWGNNTKTENMILHSPNAHCDQIITNQFWSYAR